MRADLQNELNLKQSRAIRNQVVQNLLNQIQCELPESMVEDETRSIVYSIVNEQQQRGVLKDAIDAQKDQIYGTANTAAKQRVKASFVFRSIAEKEGVRVEQVDVARRLQDMSAQCKVPFDKLVKDMEKSGRLGDVYTQILSEKVIDLLVQFAKIQDVAPAPKM